MTAARKGAGVIVRAPTGRVLFLQRGGDGDHPYTWCWPGGSYEAGETADQTAMRELKEETGHTPVFTEPAPEVDDRDGFVTLMLETDDEFEPTLNDEHGDFMWSEVDHPPEPLHPGVRDTLEAVGLPEQPAMDDHLAFDRDSVRHIDQDGRLHAALNNISKANVCPYFGREIPGHRELGLDPDKIYQLLRAPEELAKPETIRSFNNLPLLSEHVPVTSKTFDGHKPHLVVGSLGTDAEWAPPYMRNSLVVWAKDHVDGVQSEKKRELSSAYYYTADMTPGTFKGVRYDGVMRDIIANHVVLCQDGRAGDDVLVGDSMPAEIKRGSGTPPAQDSKEKLMSKTVLTRKAAAVEGALTVFLRPLLAQDAQIDIAPLLKGIGAKNYKAKKPALAISLAKLTDGKLAADADLDGMHKFLDSLDDMAGEATPVDEAAAPAEDELDEADGLLDAGEAREGDEPAGDDDACAQVLALLTDKVDSTVLGQVKAILSPEAAADDEMMAAEDNDDNVEPDKDDNGGANPDTAATDEEEEEMKVTPAAMDAAITKAVARVRKDQTALRAAEAFVRPWVGELVAMDSAEAVYRGALKALKVAGVDAVHPSALKTIISMQPLPGSRRMAPQPVMAADAAATASYAERFPGADRIHIQA
jgi:8-oxo-dGTP pyrophosphatase MutT (NUDIX family)